MVLCAFWDNQEFKSITPKSVDGHLVNACVSHTLKWAQSLNSKAQTFQTKTENKKQYIDGCSHVLQ